MIFFIVLLLVPTLLWAAIGFQGLGKRTSGIARLIFMGMLFSSASVYGVAQAMAP